jgi:hypothetical protein
MYGRLGVLGLFLAGHSTLLYITYMGHPQDGSGFFSFGRETDKDVCPGHNVHTSGIIS